MSVRVSTEIWKSSKQTGDRLLLMLAMADFADDQGICWPSQKVLAVKVRCSVRWVQKMLSDLRKSGEIEVTKQGLGRGQNTEYQIVFSANIGAEEKANISCVLNGERANVESLNSTEEKANFVVEKGELHNTKGELCAVKGERSVRTNHHITVRNRQEPSAEDLKLPFDSPEFSEAWEDWQKFKREKRQRLTPSTIKLQLSKLRTLGESRAISAIENSICHGYVGIFESKGQNAEKPLFPEGRL